MPDCNPFEGAAVSEKRLSSNFGYAQIERYNEANERGRSGTAMANGPGRKKIYREADLF